LLAAVVMLGAKVGCKVIRSQILLADACRRIDLAPPPLGVTARLLAASHAAGQLAWGPLGFTVRTIALRDDGMPLATVARVHVAERFAEAFGIAAIAIVALALSPHAILASWFGRLILVGLAAIPLALAVSSRLRAKLRDSGPALARATAWAFASSVADISVLLLAARGIHAPIDVSTAILAFLAINGACALPVTPAQLGVQESAIVVALATAGIATPQALAVALAYRAAHVVPLALVGLPALIATWARRSPAARA
jgi:uncharacterized membrane protein YbhN (UPF0104 family)